MASCPGDPQCSGQGICLPDNTCFCGPRRGMDDCSLLLSAFQKNNLVLALQWSGFAWYVIVLSIAAGCMLNIARVKGLKWILWHEVGNLTQIDPQQLPLLCCLLHCLLAVLTFGIDPYYVNPVTSPTLPASLFQAEVIAIFAVLSFLIRFWIQLQTRFRQHSGAGSISLRSFDVVFGLYLSLELAGLIVYGMGVNLPPTHPRSSKLVQIASPVIGFVYIGYTCYLLGFGFYYGWRMRTHLKRGNSGSLNDISQATLVALRKITRLLIVLCVVGIFTLVVIIINTLMNAGSFGKKGVNSIISYVILFAVLHIGFGIFLTVTLHTLGRPTDQRNRAPTIKKTPSKRLTHLSKKSAIKASTVRDPEEHAPLDVSTASGDRRDSSVPEGRDSGRLGPPKLDRRSSDQHGAPRPSGGEGRQSGYYEGRQSGYFEGRQSDGPPGHGGHGYGHDGHGHGYGQRDPEQINPNDNDRFDSENPDDVRMVLTSPLSHTSSL